MMKSILSKVEKSNHGHELIHINRTIPDGMREVIGYVMNQSAKRIRYKLLLMANDLYDGDPGIARIAAEAIEVFHNFTLVHDDIMDEAKLRRGKPTIHEKYGLNAAILSGDCLLLSAYSILSELPETKQMGAIKILNDAAFKIMEGQRMDMEFILKEDVSLDAYIQMIEYKTSVLLAASLAMGAFLSGASKSNVHRLYHFGLYLGISYQMKDDYLDIYGEQKYFGKEIAGDIRMNKQNFLTVCAYQICKGKQLQRLRMARHLHNGSKLREMLSIFDDNHVKEYAQQLMDEYFNKSMKALHAVNVADEKKQELFNLAYQIHHRQF